AAHPGAHPSPALPGGWSAFAASLARVGGEAHGPFAPHVLPGALAELVRSRAEGGRCVAAPSAAELAGPGPWEVAPVPGAAPGFADGAGPPGEGGPAAARGAGRGLL